MTDVVVKNAVYGLLSKARAFLTASFVAATFGATPLLAQSAIEMTASGGDTAAKTTAVHVLSQTVTMQNNSDNPTGTTFGAVTPAPTVTATIVLSNQPHTTIPTVVTSTQRGLIFGITGTGNAYYAPLSGFGAPANNHFSSLPVTPAAGISTTINHGVRISTNTHGLFQAGASEIGRHYMGDLTITFSAPVKDPVVHFAGLGGSFGAKGFSTEFNWIATPNVTGISRLSGNASFGVSGAQINNTSTAQNSNCTAGTGACGSVQFLGSEITSVQLGVYLQSDQTGAWSNTTVSGREAGDAFHLSISTETADMSPAFSGLPALIVPGQSYAANLVCTNAGPNTARLASCVPTVSVGTISGVVCTPTTPATVTNVAPNNNVTCAFNYVLPVGGTQTQVSFTGQTGAANDRNGGSVGTAGNNQVVTNVGVRAPKLTLVKALNGNPGRKNATDQFALSITGAGGPINTTTSGSGTTATGSAVLTTATAGQIYTLSEAAAGTTVPADYSTTYSCTNALAGGSAVSSGSTTSFATPALVSGDDLTCTFTNTFLANRLLTIAKVGPAGPVTQGETISYTVTATNAGNVALANVVVSDPKLTPNSTTCATVAVGATCQLTGTYVVKWSEHVAARVMLPGFDFPFVCFGLLPSAQHNVCVRWGMS